MTEAHRVKVKRDGPRGWHWIAASSFDPAVHVRADAPEPDAVPLGASTAPTSAATAAPQHTKGGRRAARKE